MNDSERYDALVAAARDLIGAIRDGGTWGPATGHAMNVLAALLPRPLRRDDMVTQADADRVPVGAILRDAKGTAWRVDINGLWFRDGEAGGYLPSEIGSPSWPMQVMWLPEGADQ